MSELNKIENKNSTHKIEKKHTSSIFTSTTKLILISCFIGNIFFVSDWILPKERVSAFVISEDIYELTHKPSIYQIKNSVYIYTTAGKARVDEREIVNIKENDMVYITKTIINDIVVKIEYAHNGQNIELGTIINIFFPFLFFPFLGLASSSIGYFSSKLLKQEEDIEFKFSVLSIILFIISYFIYFIT